MNKAPAFQFYPRDYLEKRVLRMDLEAQGAYMQILCYMWLDSDDQCSIENDLKVISRLLGITPTKARKLLGQIQWPGDPILLEEGDRLVSKRLRKVRQEQIALSKKRKNAAGARWGNKDDANGMQTDANALQEQCKDDANGMPFNLQSSSSTSTSKEEREYPNNSWNELTDKLLNEWIDLYPQRPAPQLIKDIRKQIYDCVSSGQRADSIRYASRQIFEGKHVLGFGRFVTNHMQGNIVPSDEDNAKAQALDCKQTIKKQGLICPNAGKEPYPYAYCIHCKW